VNEGHVDDVFGDEPSLRFVGANDVADEHVIRAVVAGIVCGFCELASFLQDQFVRFQEARNLLRNFFAMNGRAFEPGVLGDVMGDGYGDSTEGLDTFGEDVDQFCLLAKVLIEQQMELIERGT
jgi:hypothetical protein